MIVELGHLALVMALMVALVQSIAPMVGAHRGWADFMAVATPAALAQFALLSGSFAALTYAFVTSDFSVALAANHSHSLKPMLYKVSGVWGNHEGSMLLWVLILALFGALIAVFGRSLPAGLKARTLAVQGMIGVAFLLFILLTSNPFVRLDPVPFDGADLNPVLQDPALAIHPPFLYLGYVGLSTAYSFAVAALLEGRIDAAWARWVRPWALAAWMFLTVGIALGSYWAYYELGWGGWWFWDPVENASFMPWLAAVALLHSAVVVEKRGELKSWTILLAILAFSLSLMGTFIVRSGLLTSVHAFATDPGRGLFILAILGVAVGGSLWLYAIRADQLKSGGVFAPVSRESALLLNNTLMVASLGGVFAGTMAPMIYDAFGDTVTVGPPYFDLFFTVAMIPLLIALPVGAMTPWKRGDALVVLKKLWVAGVAALTLAGLTLILQTGWAAMAPIGVLLGTWVVLGAFWDLGERARVGRTAFGQSIRRLMGLPRADWGKALAHAGMGVTTLGIALITAYEREDIRMMQPNDSFEISGYTIGLQAVVEAQGPNYVAERGVFWVRKGDEIDTMLYPEKRRFPVQNQITSEAAIRPGLFDDVYIVLGDRRVLSGAPRTGFAEPGEAGGETAWAVRTYVKPFANWIWIGALFMAVGGVVSLTDRRHRVGAPAVKRAGPPSAGAVATPAE